MLPSRGRIEAGRKKHRECTVKLSFCAIGFGTAIVHLGQFNSDTMFLEPPSVEAMVQIASNFSCLEPLSATGRHFFHIFSPDHQASSGIAQFFAGGVWPRPYALQGPDSSLIREAVGRSGASPRIRMKRCGRSTKCRVFSASVNWNSPGTDKVASGIAANIKGSAIDY